jgi:chromosome segregation ATPase
MALLGRTSPPSLEVAVMQLPHLMESIVIANQHLQNTREQERELEHHRISDHQSSIQLHGSSNTSLEKQLLSLQSQIQTNGSALAAETQAETDAEKAKQDSLDHKKESVQHLLKQREALEQQIRELEKRIALQQLANQKGHTQEIDKKIAGAIFQWLGL